MKKYLMCIGCVLAAMAASAQTVSWDLDEWWDGDRAQRQAHEWVQTCDISNSLADINALGTEKESKPSEEDASSWIITSNIGTPLQLILNGSVSYNMRMEQPCSDSRRLAIAQRFLQMGADPNDGLYHQKGNNSNRFNENLKAFYKIDTPLGYAARNGKQEIAELLLQNKADPNYTWEGFWEKDESGASYDNNAHFALEQVVTSPLKNYRPNQRVQMIQLLSRYGADANAVDNCGRTPLARLMMCAAFGYGNRCPQNFNQRDYQTVAWALADAGADKKAKGRPQASCQGGMAGVSAQDIWKDMGQERKEQWKSFFKGR